MARKRTFSHFFFEKKCVFVPKSFTLHFYEGILLLFLHFYEGISLLFIHFYEGILYKLCKRCSNVMMLINLYIFPLF